jgi:hypothetical protein
VFVIETAFKARLMIPSMPSKLALVDDLAVEKVGGVDVGQQALKSIQALVPFPIQ